jgi:putative FmdB family regulatory protein
MPIYAYKCDACGRAKDVLQKMSDPLLTVCPFCGEAQFKKQLTAAGFQLKGSGWYATDFKGGPAPVADAESKGATPAEASGADAKAGEGSSASKSGESGKTETSAKAASLGSTASGTPAVAASPGGSPSVATPAPRT